MLQQKKKSKEHSHANKENILGKRPAEPTHSNYTIADDSNTCMYIQIIVISLIINKHFTYVYCSIFSQ